jgi:tetratricopeptide (TPR) repeat protein
MAVWRCILVGVISVASALAQNDASQQLLSHAVELHQSGHYAEAITAYQSYLKSHPEAAAVRSNLGAALAHEARYSEAIREYTLALKTSPSNYGIRFNLGLAYYKTGNLEGAVREFEAVYAVVPANDPQKRQVSLLLAECYLRQGDDERVVAMLSAIADADPNDLTAAYLLGTALLHRGEEERGAVMIQRILGKGDTAEAHMLMAYTRMKANDHKGAAEELDRAVALNPRLPEAFSLRGRLEFIDSNLPAAETAFRSALKLDPNYFESLLFLGTLLRQQGRLKESHSLLEHAFHLQPKEIRVRYQFAIQYSTEGNDARAAALLESLIKDAPDYTEAHRSLSAIYFRLGRPAEGRKERKVAEELDQALQTRDQELGRSLKK